MKNKYFPERDDEIYYQIVEGIRCTSYAVVIVFALAVFCASVYLTPAEFLALRLTLFGV